MPDIDLHRVTDQAALAHRWRALEALAEGGFFRSWTWLGTLLPHMTDPHLLCVRQDGQDLALGLFNRRRGSLFLHETGDPAWDRLYVEHNGLLLHPAAGACLPQALQAAASHGAVVLSGIDALHHDAASEAGTPQARKSHFAPALDLATLAATGQSHLDILSANARAQIRRAMRLYGPDLVLQSATTPAQAHHFLDRLIALHQASWTSRGEPGAFADPAITAFHHTLIDTALPRGETALLRLHTDTQDIGYLYQFQHGNRMLAYQSGFAATTNPKLKPGLVSHTMAIAHARNAGLTTYDFLAGAQRYKTTLAPKGGETLYWVTLHRPKSLRGRVHAVRRWIRG